jgi:hypothetical protein
MTSLNNFRRSLDEALNERLEEREKSARQHEALRSLRAQRAAREKSRQPDRLPPDRSLAVLEGLGQYGLEAVGFLLARGVRPSLSLDLVTKVHVVKRGYLKGSPRRYSTTPMRSWQIDGQVKTHWTETCDRVSSYEERCGSALGVDGHIYRFTDVPSGLTGGRLVTMGPLTEELGGFRAVVSQHFHSFGEVPPRVDMQAGRLSQEGADQILESWQATLSNFVIHKAMSDGAV